MRLLLDTAAMYTVTIIISAGMYAVVICCQVIVSSFCRGVCKTFARSINESPVR